MVPSGEQHITDDRVALDASGTGSIRGEGVFLTVNYRSNGQVVINAYSGGKVYLTGATINHIKNQANYSSDYTQAIRAYGQGSLVDISDSRIESFNHIAQLSDGATARFHNTEMIAHMHGLTAKDIGTSIHVTDSDITFLGKSTGFKHGIKSTGLQAKTAGSILHANRLNAKIQGDTSVGLLVQNGADVQLNNSVLNVSGNNSHGIVFNTATTSDSNSLQMTGSHVETNDG